MVVCSIIVRRLRPDVVGKLSLGRVFGRASAVGGQTATRGVTSTPVTFAERKYTDKHEWVQLEGKIGTIGITLYAQDALGDVVYAQLPDPGQEFSQMDECGALESVKAASELYCPVSGKVVEKNSTVEETPGLINKSCYEKGWLFKVELSKLHEMEGLMSEADYEKFLKTDAH